MATAAHSSNPAPLKPVWLPWLLGGIFIVWFALRDLLRTRGLVIDGLDVWGRDFANVWTGGHIIREGRLSTLTDVAAYQAFQQQLFGFTGQHNYSYPPVTFPFAALLSYLPYPLALASWQLAGVGFFIWAAKPWWPRSAGPAWLAVLTPAALLNIWAGHYGFFIGGLLLIGWRQLELGRSVVAGFCFGLMIIKPHLAVLVPIALATRREWRAIAAAAGTSLGLVAVTASIYGMQAWFDFLFGTSRVQASLIDAHGSFFGFMSTSPATATLALTGSWSIAVAAQIAFGGAAIAAVVFVGLRGVDLRAHALITATATFLVLPYAFNYDMTVVMIGAVAVISSVTASESDRRLAFYGFIGPQLGMILAGFGAPLLPVFTAGLLFAQFRQSCRPRSRQDPLAATFVPSPFNSQQA